MTSKKDKLKITKSELAILSLIKEGLLGSCLHLMNEQESKQIKKNNKLNDEIYPYALNFVLKNTKTAEKIKPNQELILTLDNKDVGSIFVKSKFKNDKSQTSIFTPLNCSLDKFEFCISGDISLNKSPIKKIKNEFLQVKKKLNAKKISAVFSSFDPLHRAHERMFRWMIDKADLVVIFLLDSVDGFSFDLKQKYLNKFIKTYLPWDRFFIFALRDVDIFRSHLNPALECILAKNLGCTKLIAGENHAGLGMFYNQNQPQNILDEFFKDSLEVIILPEIVFCNVCKMIVSRKSCPHGVHHHLHYDSKALKELLKQGIIPPSVFMRKEVSSAILSHLFPKRFKNLQQLYYKLFTNNGILENKMDEDFYEELLRTHQISSML